MLRFWSWYLAALVAAPLLPAGDAPKADKERDLEALAVKLVTQSARVREGELVQITGDVKDAEVLEDLAVQVRKQGAHPLVTLSSDRLRAACTTTCRPNTTRSRRNGT